MKKIFSFILVVMILMCVLCACNDGHEPDTIKTSESTITEVVPTNSDTQTNTVIDDSTGTVTEVSIEVGTDTTEVGTEVASTING